MLRVGSIRFLRVDLKLCTAVNYMEKRKEACFIYKKVFLALPIIFSFHNCGVNESIIEGGSFISKSQDLVATFYVYDFVSIDNVYDHASKLDNASFRTVSLYYLSHNSNIPSNKIKSSKSLNEVEDLIGEYFFNIKYIYESGEDRQVILIDCLSNPNNEKCFPVN